MHQRLNSLLLCLIFCQKSRKLPSGSIKCYFVIKFNDYDYIYKFSDKKYFNVTSETNRVYGIIKSLFFLNNLFKLELAKKKLFKYLFFTIKLNFI